MSTHCVIPALFLALLSAAAQAEELPRSSACRTAVQALEDAEDAIAASASSAAATAVDDQRRQAIAARLQPLRKRVADACLGGLTTSPPPSQRTWVLPESPVRPGVLTPRLAQPTPPPVTPPRQEPPVMLTHCNATTCIASDGSMLTRVAPGLVVGPRGHCTVQGPFVRCP